MVRNVLDETAADSPFRLEPPQELFPRWLKVAAAVAILVGAAGALVHVPYHSLQPGSTVDVLGEIEVRGARTFSSGGKLLLTTVSVSSGTLTAVDALRVWLDPDVAAVHREYLYPSNVRPADVDLDNEVAIRESKIVAAAAAFRALGEDVRPNGARVFRTVAGQPARGVLRPGDRVVAIDGVRLATRRAVVLAIGTRRVGLVPRYLRLGSRPRGMRLRARIRNRIEAAPRIPQDPIRVTVVRDDRRRVFDLRMGVDQGSARLGVILLSSFAVPDVRIDSGQIVGPSAGLVFALTIVDSFTPDDLTGGRVIGVTGAIARDGSVGEIGGAFHKVRGAVAAGATVFLVPKPEEAEAIAAAPDGMTVIGVDTLEEAIAALRALEPADGELAQVP